MPHHINKTSFKKGMTPWNKGSKGLQLAWNKGKKMPQISLSDSPHWKGDSAGQSAMHFWIKKYFPKPDKCQRCNKVTEILDASNNSGKYLRDVSDWEYICKHCHRLKDKMSLGEKNGRAKLNEKQVLEIRRLSSSYSIPILADRYNVNIETIRAIIKRLTWQHLYV